MTEWFVYVQRKHDGRKAIVAGPYPSMDRANDRWRDARDLAMKKSKDGEWLWFETWGVCEAPAGVLHAAFGEV